jgi:hypothetical protein
MVIKLGFMGEGKRRTFPMNTLLINEFRLGPTARLEAAAFQNQFSNLPEHSDYALQEALAQNTQLLPYRQADLGGEDVILRSANFFQQTAIDIHQHP